MPYLVNSGDDELLLVVRYRFPAYSLRLGDQLVHPLDYFRTSGFDVFRMNWSGLKLKWDRMENLGEQLLSIGENSSSSLRASDNCDVGGCLWNSIYFIDDIFQGFYDEYHDIQWGWQNEFIGRPVCNLW